jgi:hypothetical protein
VTHVWRLRVRLPERFGEACRVLARGTMNSCLIEFQDGTRHVASRFAVRKAGLSGREEEKGDHAEEHRTGQHDQKGLPAGVIL